MEIDQLLVELSESELQATNGGGRVITNIVDVPVNPGNFS
jgi:hypothetical protein